MPDGSAPLPIAETETHARDAALWRRWRAGDDGALARLAALYEPMVGRCARAARRAHSWASIDDAMQGGRLGLLVALRRWDPAFGVALAGYARRDVASGCVSAVRAQAPAGCDDPAAVVSLDDTAPGAEDGGPALTMGEMLGDPTAPDPDDMLDLDTGRTALRLAVDALGSERMRDIVRGRLLTDPPIPLAALAQRFGVSTSRIVQIQAAGHAQVIAAVREMLNATRRR